MVLPHTILFPQAVLPLHIFEQRYRLMVEDTLHTHRLIGVGTLRPPGEVEETYDVLSVGLVRVAVGRPDGTTNMILQGVSRVRVLGVLHETPYRVVRIEPLVSSGADTVAVDALASRLSELVVTRTHLGGPNADVALKFLTRLHDPSTLSDLVSFFLVDNEQEKQSLLETLDVRERLRRVITLLEHQISHLQALKKFQSDGGSDQAKLN